jgi:hypothetical protein
VGHGLIPLRFIAPLQWLFFSIDEALNQAYTGVELEEVSCVIRRVR